MRGQMANVGLVLVLLAGCGGDDAADGSGDTASIEPGRSDASTSGDEAGDVPDDGSGDASNAAGDDGNEGVGGTDVELDVCGMLPPADVAGVTGVDPGPGTASDTPPFFGCDFDFPGGLVSVSVIVWPDEDDARDSMEFAFADEYPDVEGIGDDAYDAAPAFGLTARSGRFEISVNVIGEFESHEDLDQERQLAQMIIDRLP